ncbi:MAG: ABC transporter permease subunit [Phycisphaeraceae bacterium]|nr:ABC transporter permease subunit [Phycisphaeraceae bacterium]
MGVLWHYLWRLGVGNPMVLRVVHNGSRHLRHLWARLGYLGAMVMLMLVGLLAGQGMSGEVSLVDLAKSGSDLFRWISYTQVILICLLAPLFMATAIAQERAGQTMEILLTTPLSNLQIVLGSYLGRLFFVLTLLASGLPLFAVLLIFGGVPMKSVFISFAVAAETAMFMGAAAVTLSVFRAGGRKAVFAFVIGMAGYLVGAYLFDRWLLQPYSAGTTTWLTPIHPLLVLESTMRTATYHPPAPETLGHLPGVVAFYLGRPFAAFSMLSIAATVLMLVASALMLRYLSSSGAVMLTWMQKQIHIGPVRGEGWPARSVWSNPIAWREAHTRGGGGVGFTARWSFTAVGLLATAVLLLLHHMNALPTLPNKTTATESFRALLTWMLLVQMAVIGLVAIYMSAGCVSKEREDGTLDLMLTTPVSPKQYIWGKLRGLVSFLGALIATPVVSLLMVSVYVAIAQMMQWDTAGSVVGMPSGASYVQRWTPLVLYESPLLMLLLLLPFVSLCVMMGMNWSLKARGVLGAVIPTLAVVSVLVLLMGFCGYNTAANLPIIGPLVNAFSPVSGLLMIVDPWNCVAEFAGNEFGTRVLLLIAACIAAAGYCLIVWGILQHMVSGFDQTVRRLSGTG